MECPDKDNTMGPIRRCSKPCGISCVKCVYKRARFASPCSCVMLTPSPGEGTFWAVDYVIGTRVINLDVLEVSRFKGVTDKNALL